MPGSASATRAASTSSRPTIIAQADGRDYSDIDVIRLDDGRFLAVVREHQTRQSVYVALGRRGPHLVADRADAVPRLEHQAVPAALRGDRLRLPRRGPARRGVSLSVSHDGGETWSLAGQLYAADPDALHEPGSVCGYPDVVTFSVGRSRRRPARLSGRSGGTQLHWLRLRDLT